MILVTGGAGLVGTALIEKLLRQGEKLRAIYNKTPLSISSPLLEQIHCDILDVMGLEEAFINVQQVYHCAGLVSFFPSDVKRLYKINVEGTANIVNAALYAGVKKMLHVSSVAALGRIRENEVITEQMQWTPATSNSKYGHSKYLGELEVWRGIAEGLDAVIVNPVIVLGPGNWDEGSTKIFKSVYEEFPWYTEGITGFVDVRDVADAMVALMNSDVNEQRFILSGGNHTYREIFNRIAVCFGKKPPHKKVTPFLSKLVVMAAGLKQMVTGKKPLITKETAATAMAKVNFDNSKLLNFLPGFSYRSLQDTIEYTCKIFEQKLNKH